MAVASDLARMRLEYATDGLDVADLAPDPLTQFHRWLAAASGAGLVEPNAMVLATVDAAGQPWSRYVLLKAATADGFDFYTNYGSDKSAQLDHEPRVALTFGWTALGRQVNITGRAERVPGSEADEYWALRPRGSQIGALASHQSRPLADRDELLERYERLDRESGDVVARPDHWGGWRVRPATVEFWQGRLNRLHDRFRYRATGGAWELVRLSP